MSSSAPADPTAPRALILTVGIQPRAQADEIVEALMRDVTAYGPDLVAIASTAQSRPVAEALEEQVRAVTPTVEHIALDSAHNLDHVFSRIRGAIADLRSRGFPRENIAVNYASGTKVMSSGLVLAAVFEGCGDLRYVRPARGLPLDQRLIALPASAIFAIRDIEQALLLGAELRFVSAGQILRRVPRQLLSAGEQQIVDDLTAIFEAYHQWDGFRVGRFLELYRQAAFAQPQLEAFRLDDASMALAEDLARDLKRRRPSPLICIELFNSAARRRRYGAMDDAVTRLYRALETLAQERLLNGYDIYANDLEAPKAPPRYRPDFEALRSLQDGRIRLGLRKAYELLYRLEDPLGIDFQSDPQMAQRLEERRDAILAHGFDAIAPDREAAFFDWARGFLANHIDRFEPLSRALQFPWLREPATP